MDIRNELRAILRAARTANDNPSSGAPAARVEHIHSGRIEHVVTGAASPPAWVFSALALPVFAAAGRSNVRPARPGRLVLNPAPWVRREMAREERS